MPQKSVIVTGANGGLGASVTRAFLESGARVFGVAPSLRASDFDHPNFVALAGKISSGSDAQALIDAATAQAGRIHGLVHLVGGFAGGKAVAETGDATLDRMLDLNLRSAFFLIRAVVPHMRASGGGRIVAIGSKAAVEPAPMAGAYAASKAALVSLIRTVAREEAAHGITANIVLPGTMDTPANRAGDPKADPSKWVQPAQVAALLVHLLSAQASQLSGAAIPVYGIEA